jgi:hypothetical protein
MEAPTNLYKLTISSLGPTSNVNLLLDVISSELLDRLPIYKRPPTHQAGGMRSFPPSLHKLLELSAHPIVTTIQLQYQTAGCRDITSMEGPEPG